MIILLSIFQYFAQSIVDVMDKFLISKRKIEPASYTFYTVVTGALLLAVWPWFYHSLPAKFILLNLLSGAFFSLMMYVYFKALSYGEVSRVVPFVFGIVPVFDILISWVTGRNTLSMGQFAALWLLVPGALLISYHPGRRSAKHLAIKILAAFLISGYDALWQYGAQVGPSLNNLMWNRLGAAFVLVVLLVLPAFRKKIFSVRQVEKKAHTSILFVAKQALGGANFIFLSYLYAIGTIPVISALQGFRYLFLFIFGWIARKHHSHILDEEVNRKIINQKVFALSLICLGALILFIL